MRPKHVEFHLLLGRKDRADMRAAFEANLFFLRIERRIECGPLRARIVDDRNHLFLLIGRQLQLMRALRNHLSAVRVRVHGLGLTQDALAPQMDAHAAEEHPQQKHHEKESRCFSPCFSGCHGCFPPPLSELHLRLPAC